MVDPSEVETASDHELTVFGSTFKPNSELLLGPCIAPGDPLVPGVSTPDEI